MRVVEKHNIAKNHKYFKEIDMLCFFSKNLYNQANYIIRQSFIKEKKYLNYNEIQKILQTHETYKSLPSKVSQQILIILDKNWKSFFKSIKEYVKKPNKYLGKPKLPRYKDKIKGRNILVYTIQAISKKEIKKGIVKLSGTNISIKTEQEKIQQIRIVPRNNEYVIEIIYEKGEEKLNLNKENFISIDIGLNNLATITSNKINPLIVNGRVLKSVNQFYNKEKAKLQSFIGDKGTSKRIIKLTNKRNKKVSDFLHKSSRYIVNQCLKNDIGTIIIGKNENWKQDINIGSKNNQSFVNIPHSTFIKMIEYKAKLLGISVILTNESYTSKCSFIDNEPLVKQSNYLGKRVKRGLFKSADGIKINADVNGSLNIARKVIPNVDINNLILTKGIEGIVVFPVRVNPYKLKVS
jgi:putative transposase